MSFDPDDPHLNVMLPHQLWHRLFANLIFDSFVKDIVREHYHTDPVHVTLQITPSESVLYVRAETGGSILVEDEDLKDWALQFIAAEVFSVNPDDVEMIYLDGDVGAEDVYLHMAGRGIYVSSGDSKRTGRYL